MPVSINNYNMQGHCRGCGIFYESIRKHLSKNSTCSKLYLIDINDFKNNPDYILSGPCRGCNRWFKSIRCHLSGGKCPEQCSAAYKPGELKAAATEKFRQLKKASDKANKHQKSEYHREYYANNKEKIKKQSKAYYEAHKGKR